MARKRLQEAPPSETPTEIQILPEGSSTRKVTRSNAPRITEKSILDNLEGSLEEWWASLRYGIRIRDPRCLQLGSQVLGLTSNPKAGVSITMNNVNQNRAEARAAAAVDPTPGTPGRISFESLVRQFDARDSAMKADREIIDVESE
jgi:hypothetical protein